MSHCCGNNGHEVTLEVEGMSCQHCAMAIKQAISRLDGVSNVLVNLEEGEVSVTYDGGRTKVEQIRQAIQDSGYQTK
ncbi:MAG: copper ion binding protein [Bacillota bacterium]